LSAVWGMLATPFDEKATNIDVESLARLSTHLARNGCTSLVALGVVAEPETLSMDEKILVLSVVSSAAPTVPVIATVMEIDSSAPCLASDLARELDGRLAAVMVPVSHERGDELRARLKEVHRRTGLPVVIQDYPAPTGVRIPLPELIGAIDGLDFIDAIKCECAPTFSRIRALRPATTARLIAGYGGIGLASDLESGASGVAVGVTVPEVLADAMRCWAHGDKAETIATIASKSGLIQYETSPGHSIAIRKEHWRRLGIIEHATVRPPTSPWSEDLDALSALHGYPEVSRV
jgi:4-hydroxy-tetrahydrodipicolinate synthase